MKNLISIITVCYNDKQNLIKTINSVLEQTYCEYEYVVIDGGSTDGTVDEVKNFEQQFRTKGITFTWLSEKDSGLYNAMNKGLKRANNSWVNYLNAGDCYASSDTVSCVAETIRFQSEMTKVVYGAVYYCKENKKWLKKTNPLKAMYKGMVVNHQTAFIKKSYHDINPYNEDYKYAADYHFMYTIYCNYGETAFCCIDKPLILFDRNGLTKYNWKASALEAKKVIQDITPHKVILWQINYWLSILKKAILRTIKQEDY